MKLSTLSILLGAVCSAQQIFGLLKPAAFSRAARNFPRSEPWGYALTGLGTVWFLANLNAESISDFAAYKNVMFAGFGGIGLLTCLYVRDFLAVRGLSVVLLLLAKLVLDTARPHDSQWRLLLSALSYAWVLAGMWFTISPWRLRDILNWMTASESRVRTFCGARLALGLLILSLGLFVF
jgi:hypothetical protein